MSVISDQPTNLQRASKLKLKLTYSMLPSGNIEIGYINYEILKHSTPYYP